jgi:hypothetical protein
MKRPYLDDDGPVPKKKRRCETVTPFSNTVDLAYLYGLKMFVFDQQPFCFCMQKGMAVANEQCLYCPPQPKFSSFENERSAMDSFKRISHLEDDNYIAYALMRELFRLGDAARIDVSQVDDTIQLNVKDVLHLSPFCIHLLLMKDFVEDIRIDLMTRAMVVVCKRGDKIMETQNISSDKILNDDLTRMKRNILTLTRQSELRQFL